MAANGSSPQRPRWLSVSVTVPRMLAEPVAGILIRRSGQGVELDETGDDRDKTMIIGYFPMEETGPEDELPKGYIEKQLTAIRRDLDELQLFSEDDPPVINYRVFEDEDWSATWKRFFKPFEIIPGLIIKPSWEHYPHKPGLHILELDPGMAFGTGQHVSTRMALTLLHTVFPLRPPGTVLDVGCGTGILGMAAAVFGAVRVICIDNDATAVSVAIDNVNKNRLGHIVQVGHTPLVDISGPFGVICANIVHDVLEKMAADFERLLAGNGRLIVSGILRGEQESNLKRVYRRWGFKPLATQYKGEWAAMLFGRRAVVTSILL